MDYEKEIKELQLEIDRLKATIASADQRYVSRRFVLDLADCLEETNKKLNDNTAVIRGSLNMLFEKVFPGLGKTMDQIKGIIGDDDEGLPPSKPAA